jgi:hypothetical protein
LNKHESHAVGLVRNGRYPNLSTSVRSRASHTTKDLDVVELYSAIGKELVYGIVLNFRTPQILIQAERTLVGSMADAERFRRAACTPAVRAQVSGSVNSPVPTALVKHRAKFKITFLAPLPTSICLNTYSCAPSSGLVYNSPTFGTPAAGRHGPSHA